ncbi:MAG TPA: helix-turn-helix domain-containing protein [Ktedonobacterales bacterium]|jgi:DNA-binding HxlR family transcriptional regulator
MGKYGQYCPVAQALEIVGDRWTLLIIRDLLTGATRFNALRRGLPGLSRTLLAKRLRQLERAGVVERRVDTARQRMTAYHLTPAGRELQTVIDALLVWGATWAFGDPSPDMLDPLLLMWWMRERVNTALLPEGRTVIQFDFTGATTATYWLLLTREDVNVCMTDPGYGIDVLVTADLATSFRLWLGRIDYAGAIARGGVRLEGAPRLVRAFPNWFAWSHAAPAVRAALATRGALSG